MVHRAALSSVFLVCVYRKSIPGLRSVTCQMGSHSVTCQPTQMNAPHLNPGRPVLDLFDPEGWKAELIWVPSTKCQFALPDHGYGASASHGVPVCANSDKLITNFLSHRKSDKTDNLKHVCDVCTVYSHTLCLNCKAVTSADSVLNHASSHGWWIVPARSRCLGELCLKRGSHPTQRTQRNESKQRKERQKRKLQPIGTELLSFRLN